MKRGTYRARLFLMMAGWGMLVLFVSASAMAAGWQPQEITGTVKFAAAADAQWQVLTRDIAIQTGYKLQTGPQSVASLQAEDGSVLFLGENTELTVIAMAGSPREYRFTLAKGTLLLEATRGRSENERLEIETPMVMTNVATPQKQATSLQVVYKPATPECHVYGFQGKIVFTQIVNGASELSGLFGVRGERNEGINFPVNRKGAEVTLEVLADQSTIVVQTNLAIEKLIAMLGEYIGMETTYLDEDDRAPLELSLSENKAPIVLKKKDEQVMIVTAPANVVRGVARNWLFARFRFFREFGDNDFLWFRDDCNCVELYWEEGGPGPEVPVIPPPPREPPKEPAGSPIMP